MFQILCFACLLPSLLAHEYFNKKSYCTVFVILLLRLIVFTYFVLFDYNGMDLFSWAVVSITLLQIIVLSVVITIEHKIKLSRETFKNSPDDIH